MDSTSQNRAKAHADIVEKQKKREERAKQVRERARKIKEGEAVDGHNDEDAAVETYHVESDGKNNLSYLQWKGYVVSIICKSYGDIMETVWRVILLWIFCGKINREIV